MFLLLTVASFSIFSSSTPSSLLPFTAGQMVNQTEGWTGRKTERQVDKRCRSVWMENTVSSDLLWASLNPGNPWRLHYPRSVPEPARLHVCVQTQNTFEKPAVVYCALITLPLTSPHLNLSWICNGVTRGSHYRERKYKSSQQPLFSTCRRITSSFW